MNLFKRAAQLMPLTPAGRAFLKTLQGLFITALIVALQTAIQYLAAPGTIDKTRLVEESLLLGLFSLLHGILKYFTANGDAGLSMLAAAADQELSVGEKALQGMVMDGGRGTVSMPAVAPQVVRASTPPPVPVQYQATAAMPVQNPGVMSAEQSYQYQMWLMQQQRQAAQQPQNVAPHG
jgi:hypothetical protein